MIIGSAMLAVNLIEKEENKRSFESILINI